MKYILMKKIFITAFFESVLLLAATIDGLPANARTARSLNDGWIFRKIQDTVATSVHLPHCWNAQDAYSSREYYRGKGVYSKSLHISNDNLKKRHFLKIDGAASASEIIIDGKYVGNTMGAYSSHTFDITPFVVQSKGISSDGEHNLTIIVDNSRQDIPPYSADFTFMGGLYRDVWLISSEDIHLEITKGTEAGINVESRVVNDNVGSLKLSGDIVNNRDHSKKVLLSVTVSDHNGNVMIKKKSNIDLHAGSSSKFSCELDEIDNIDLWTPETPIIYKVNVEIFEGNKILDSASEYTAFRTFSFDNQGQFLLNGIPYKLRGVCRHQDRRSVGIALTDEEHRRDLNLAKELGANFIRISHYPQDDAVLEMCDRLGLIVWEEIPVIDFVSDNEALSDNCEIMLQDMIRRHRNHPSIAMWGYMNEILLRIPPNKREEAWSRTLDLAHHLEKVLKSEDPDRLSTMAFHGSDVYYEAGLADITDVKGWNLYQGWYGGKLEDFPAFLSRQHREHPEHKYIVSEYGAGSDLRIHSLNPQPFDFSIEYQQKYLESYLPVIEDSAFVAGASHWNLIDFSSANREESMPHINNKGILTNNRKKKMYSIILQLCGMNWKKIL